MILAVVNDLLGETALAAAGLQKLEEAFALFANNTQIYPLVYECKSRSNSPLPAIPSCPLLSRAPCSPS